MGETVVRIPIIGMGCAAESSALERKLTQLPGVHAAYVNSVTETAHLTVNPDGFNGGEALHVIEAFGFRGLAPAPEAGLVKSPTATHIDPFLDLLHGHLKPGGSTDLERVGRIAAEAAESFQKLQGIHRAVAVFGSARAPVSAEWGNVTRATVGALAEAGFTIITGGGPGIMEAANEAARRGGTPSVGLSIELPHEQAANHHLDLEVPFHYFFLRKLAFVKYACAFVCLPGGFGTLDEMFEALNLKLTGKVHDFPVLLVGRAYWQGLFDWLTTTSVGTGALSKKDLESLEVTDDPDLVVSRAIECHHTLCASLGLHGARPHADSPDQP